MFPKKGKVFPGSLCGNQPGLDYAAVVAAALRSQLGNTHQAVKTVVKWTNVDERTIKNWFAGTNGPSGRHLISLLRHSDQVLEACLLLAGRDSVLAHSKFAAARHKLRELLAILDSEDPPYAISNTQGEPPHLQNS